MKRGKPLKRTPFRSRRRRPPMDPALWALVYARDGGRSQLSGEPVAEHEAQVHHRKLRSQGGTDDPANLILLSPADHRAVHAHPAQSVESGFIVPRDEDPCTRPVHRYLTTWGQPTATGWELPGGRPDTPGDAA